MPSDVPFHFSDGPGNTASGAQVSTNFSTVTGFIDDVAAAAGVPVPVTNAKMRGSSPILTTGTRTNAAYGPLSDGPDQVSGLVLPTNGIIRVLFLGYWVESVDNAARAAIFLNSNQLQVSQAGVAAPAVQEAACSGAAGIAQPLSSTWFGLSSNAAQALATGHAAPVTTGQAIALQGLTSTDQGGGLSGGACEIFAAAGTYTVSVQFKASSGTVSALNRRLFVKAEGY